MGLVPFLWGDYLDGRYDGRASPTSKSYKNHQRSGPGEDDVGEVLMRTRQTIMGSTGHPRNSFISSSTLLPHSTYHRHLVHQRARHQELDGLRLRLIMSLNGFAVMTLLLGAKTDATTDECQRRKWHSSMTRLRCRHPRTPNSR